MFGNNQYWYCGLLIFLLFIAINVGIIFLRKSPKASYATAYAIGAFLLVYKICEYLYWQAIGRHMHFPVEFSALSYFIFGIFTTFRIKKCDCFAAFTAILAGFFYSVSFWISPDSFVNGEESKFLFAMAIINHHMLFAGGMLMLANVRRYEFKKTVYQHFIGIALMVGYSWLIYGCTNYSQTEGKPIIIKITDGQILQFLFPQGASLLGWQLALYYVGVCVALCAFIAAFYGLNAYGIKYRRKHSLNEDCFPDKLTDAFEISRKPY